MWGIYTLPLYFTVFLANVNLFLNIVFFKENLQESYIPVLTTGMEFTIIPSYEKYEKCDFLGGYPWLVENTYSAKANHKGYSALQK